MLPPAPRTACALTHGCAYPPPHTRARTDLLLNWDSIRAPFVRLLIMLALTGATIAVEYLEVPYLRVQG